MPCVYYTTKEELALANLETNKARSKVNELTRLLCEVEDYIEPTGFIVVKGLTEFYEKHRKHDQERLRQSALAKLSRLTEEEIEALGLSLDEL